MHRRPTSRAEVKTGIVTATAKQLGQRWTHALSSAKSDVTKAFKMKSASS